jgi:hypothetical protein
MIQLVFQNPSKQRAHIEALLAPDPACSPTVIVGPSPRPRFARIYRSRLGGLLALDVPSEDMTGCPVELGAAALLEILLADKATWKEREVVLGLDVSTSHTSAQLFGAAGSAGEDYGARERFCQAVAVYSAPATVPEGLEPGEDWIPCSGTPLQVALESVALAAAGDAPATMAIVAAGDRMYFGAGGSDWILVVHGPANECDLVLPPLQPSVVLPPCLEPVLAMGPDAVSVDATGLLFGAQHAGLQCVAWARSGEGDPVAGSLVPIVMMDPGTSLISVDAKAEIKVAAKAAKADVRARHPLGDLGMVNADSLRRVLSVMGVKDVRGSCALGGPPMLERQLAPGWTCRAVLATH